MSKYMLTMMLRIRWLHCLINSDVTGSDAVYGVVTDQAENNSDLEYEVTMLIDGKSGTYDTDKAEPEYKYDELYKVTFSPAGEAKLAAADPNATASAVVTTAGGFELSGNVVKCTTTAGMGTVVNIEVDDVLIISKTFRRAEQSALCFDFKGSYVKCWG
jgi:hypothetical protein